MYKESLVIEHFERIRREKIRYIERQLEIKPTRRKAISIIGPRRAGKTYFLLNQFL
ncbi:MAG: hypothetical protein J7L39_04075 [Candidatus Aenigmarchaeota archaeon]|nr:hypothetical protein [Candidatus Aenigmarchaeota archaeon]